ncbi:SPFH domain-containing protein [Streptomyces anandii]|uniref:SPFH domain-containing protein n=1 Tax=Streptomyces anandii TaxID=285454 RepID=UPI001677EACF|nr:flotillin family protein [Streptomyces anandii]GGX75828.1 flotillin family protein [Streptomyces anandii JCM 4720]
MFGYRVPAPDEAMLISGGRRGLGGAPFRVVTGHGKFVLPVLRKVRFLTLSMCESEVVETCVTKQGIALHVRAVIAFKVGNDTESIINAGQRFLSDQDQMSVLTGRIFAGHLRAIIGSMTVEEIVTERQKLAAEVLDTSKTEMAKIGLIVDSLQIQSIDDGDTGYIDAMSAPHKAAIQRQAQIAQAQANQAAAEAQQEAARKQAEYARQTAVVKAEYSAEVDRAQAHSAQAGPLAQAHAQQEVLAAQTELAERQAELRQQQLVAEVVKPAEAEAERVRILAAAEAQRMKIQAEAAASYDRVALDRMLIEQLPQIVKEASGGLSGANVNVLNGADGLGEIAAGLVAQGLTILDSVRQNLNGQNGQGNQSGGQGKGLLERLELQGPKPANDNGDDRGAGAND